MARRHAASQQQLLAAARDALRGAAHPATAPASGADLAVMVGTLADSLDALDAAVERVARQVVADCRAGRAVAVDGVFEGDALAAADAVSLWLQRSRASLAEARSSVVNAHIAAGGLAAPF